MEDIIQVQEQFYIVATSSRIDTRTQVLKHGDTFALFDLYGDMEQVGRGELGLYHGGTRHLSRITLSINGRRPLLLGSTIKEDNTLLAIDLTNPDFLHDHNQIMPKGILHVFRSNLLWNGTCYVRLRFYNYSLAQVNITFDLQFDADFADIFEVRGVKRVNRGEKRETVDGDDTLIYSYEGLDGVTRCTTITSLPRPKEIRNSAMHFKLSLLPSGHANFFVSIACTSSENMPSILPYGRAFSEAALKAKAARSEYSEIITSSTRFNGWIRRSISDLHMMITKTPDGPYPYAGVPWFATPFGRDGIITAFESLWILPDIAKGVLCFLAATQVQDFNSEQDAEPGKIIHEMRKGEMAALGEIPFGRYYGSVDSTPLFVLLAGAYYERTGDLELIKSIWSNIERALDWIDHYGDLDGDGFIEYKRHSSKGLVQQGWKDSQDSVFYEDGILAEGPIALCEVQGYVYAAREYAAKLALALDKDEMAQQLIIQAETLKQKFGEFFWCEDLGVYALALDGSKRPCRVRTSNSGQCLFTGIADPEPAKRHAFYLLSRDSYSGWGIRTVATTEIRYNPMSYHNGSIWPHDNALIALGLSRYGQQQAVLQILTGIFDASLYVGAYRLPELFCGFRRRPGESPTLYPVACSPQSWASASVFLLLQASWGLSINAPEKEVRFNRPVMPRFLHEIIINGLKVGEATVDVALHKHPEDVSVTVLRKEGDVKVLVEK